MSDQPTTTLAATTLDGAIAVTRFGLGAREGEILTASHNPRQWLKSQLSVERASPFPTAGILDSKGYIMGIQRLQQRRKAQSDPVLERSIVKAYNDKNRTLIAKEHRARFAYGMNTQLPFQERLVRFWSNHFSVSGQSRRNLKAATHEREAIRPAIMGSFYELALSAILHPAMLLFLDNANSIGPNSEMGLRSTRKRKGLNENLAREVLELHTLTPRGGYTQNDVTEFAKALTGWTIGEVSAPPAIQGVAVFSEHSHEPGRRRILNKTYLPLGQDLAPVIIRNVCGHPETAANVAFKLAKHFVADTPPPSLVETLKQTFIQTGGYLPAVYEALIDAPESWEPRQQKIKTPDDLLTSTARLLGEKPTFPTLRRDVYEGFGQRPFTAPTPEGWPDNIDAWLGPDAVTKRIEWASTVAEGLPNIDARKFLTDALGPRVSEKTVQLVAGAESGEQALVIALMSPEFQRR